MRNHKAKTSNKAEERPSDRATMHRWLDKHRNIMLDLLLTILDDIYNLNLQYGLADYTKDKEVLVNRFNSEGIQFATSTMPLLFTSLLSYLETGRPVYPGFRMKRGCCYPLFLSGLTSQVLDTTTDPLQQSTALGQIYQLCVAFKKIEGPYPKSVLRKQVADFVEVDKSLSQIDLWLESNNVILEHARAIVNSIFKDIDPLDTRLALPHPGPGATNTKVEKNMRYRPHVLYTQLHDVFDYQEWFYAHPWLACEESKTYLLLHKKKCRAPRSRKVFVHKQFGKARGIFIEENEMQFLQQGIKNVLYEHLEMHPATKGRVNFSSQLINQILALQSSDDMEYGTLDMSEGSNRVLRDLVYYLFQDQENWLSVLNALSTKVVELPHDLTDNPLLYTNMYAPMGSGLCFPIMSIVHYVLCKSIILNSALKDRYKMSKKVYVYGDDIILPSVCVQAIYDWLPRFGMKLNTNKSYYASHFRESCGLHAYKGVEITPVYFNSIPTSSSHLGSLLSIIAKEASLFNKGYKATCNYLRRMCAEHFGVLPYVRPDTSILGWRRNDTTDTHIKTYASKLRYNRDLQRTEYRMRMIIDTGINLPITHNDGYLRKLTTLAEMKGFVKGSSTELKVRWKWVSDSSM